MKYTEKQVNEIIEWVVKDGGDGSVYVDFGEYELEVQDLNKENIKDLIKHILFRIK